MQRINLRPLNLAGKETYLCIWIKGYTSVHSYRCVALTDTYTSVHSCRFLTLTGSKRIRPYEEHLMV